MLTSSEPPLLLAYRDGLSLIDYKGAPKSAIHVVSFGADETGNRTGEGLVMILMLEFSPSLPLALLPQHHTPPVHRPHRFLR